MFEGLDIARLANKFLEFFENNLTIS